MASDLNTLFSFINTGLDTDSDLVTISKGDSRHRKNVVISDDGNFNVITNPLGNTFKQLPVIAGTYKIIGYVEDKENEAGIIFIYNSSGWHAIERYNSKDDSSTPFISIIWASWNVFFSAIKTIDAVIIGNGNDQFLVWVDGVNPPKCLNIAKAIAYEYVDSIDHKAFSLWTTSLYKIPFIRNISVIYGYDPDYDNNLKEKIFQFSIRLKYFDNTYTTLSAWSEISIPQYENLPNGRIADDLQNNVIHISFHFNHPPCVVSSYQLLFRIIDIGAGAPSSWHIYDNYDYNEGNINIDFYNEKSTGILDDKEAVRLYDLVPNLSNHVGVVDSNRIILDVASEGFNNVDYNNINQWDVLLTPTETAISSSDNGIEYSENASVGYTAGGYVHEDYLRPLIYDDDTDDFHYIVRCTKNTGGVEEHLYYYIESSYNFSTIRNSVLNTIEKIVSFINSTGYPVLAVMEWDWDGVAFDRNYIKITSTASAPPPDIFVRVEIVVLSKTKTFRSLKTQSINKFGIRYGYTGKVGSVQFDNNLIKETLSFDELTATDTLYTVGMRLDINHQAPYGATDFQIVSFGNNIDKFEEYIVTYNSSDLNDDDSKFTMYSDNSNVIIKKDDMINRFRDAYNSSESGGVSYGINYGMDINKGDTIRFVGQSKYVDGIYYYDFALFKTNLDFTIDYVTPTEIKIGASALEKINTFVTPASGTKIILIQIIRKKDFSSNMAYEFSKVYEINNRYHSGNIRNQESYQSAQIEITNDFCDIWKSKQVFINQHNSSDYSTYFTFFSFGWMEKQCISLYYDSTPSKQGRENFVNELAEAKGYNKIRWGGKFIDDAGVNFMSKFEWDGVKVLDDRNGSITKIQQIGDTLKVYQERKVNSLYLKTTSADNPDGTSTFVFSDNVMSDPRQSINDYGCTHFTSYTKNIRTGFFFDIINGDVLKDTPNGINSITEGHYKMSTYFKEKSKQILEYGKDDVNILGEYDDYLNMYILAFIVPDDLSHTINDCVAFHEPSNKWFTHFRLSTSKALEYFGRLSGKTIISFVDGEFWLHNNNQIRNNFWGEQFDSEIWIHANEAPSSNKLYDSIEINSRGAWSCPDDDSIEINKPSLMRSRLLSGKFKLQEGIYRSEFLRSALNGVNSFIRNLLFNGKRLRGREMTIKLKNTDTTEAQLETVTVKSTISE